MKRIIRKAKAFTLIELIVVVIIIAILAAIGAVSYNSFVANTKKSAVNTAASQFLKSYVGSFNYNTQTAPSNTNAQNVVQGVKDAIDDVAGNTPGTTTTLSTAASQIGSTNLQYSTDSTSAPTKVTLGNVGSGACMVFGLPQGTGAGTGGTVNYTAPSNTTGYVAPKLESQGYTFPTSGATCP